MALTGCAPTTAWEAHCWCAGITRVAGVDEVGRGAGAGPVVAAAVVLPCSFQGLADARDSKLLSPRTRERLDAEIRAQALRVALGAASVREIEQRNVRGATALAMTRALRRVGPWQHALIDGLPMPELPADRCTAIVDGDALCLSIACASIVAKVARDRLLALLAAPYPMYGWGRNAGYLTAEHRAAVARHGPTPHHRLRWLRDLTPPVVQNPSPRL